MHRQNHVEVVMALELCGDKIKKRGVIILPRLENWFISSEGSPYQAPELQKKRLTGAIYEDEKHRFEDGKIVTTSSLIELDLKNNIAKTRNTKYILGKPSENYLKWLKENNMALEQFE